METIKSQELTPRLMDNTVLETLKKVCEEDENVKMAFVFGSFAKGGDIPESDVDVAVYLKDPDKHHEVWRKIDSVVARDTDLVVLNIARPTIAWAALRGVPLVIKDHKFHLEYMLRVSSEAEDCYEYALDFFNWCKKVKRHVAA